MRFTACEDCGEHCVVHPSLDRVASVAGASSQDPMDIDDNAKLDAFIAAQEHPILDPRYVFNPDDWEIVPFEPLENGWPGVDPPHFVHIMRYRDKEMDGASLRTRMLAGLQEQEDYVGGEYVEQIDDSEKYTVDIAILAYTPIILRKDDKPYDYETMRKYALPVNANLGRVHVFTTGVLMRQVQNMQEQHNTDMNIMIKTHHPRCVACRGGVRIDAMPNFVYVTDDQWERTTETLSDMFDMWIDIITKALTPAWLEVPDAGSARETRERKLYGDELMAERARLVKAYHNFLDVDIAKEDARAQRKQWENKKKAGWPTYNAGFIQNRIILFKYPIILMIGWNEYPALLSDFYFTLDRGRDYTAAREEYKNLLELFGIDFNAIFETDRWIELFRSLYALHNKLGIKAAIRAYETSRKIKEADPPRSADGPNAQGPLLLIMQNMRRRLGNMREFFTSTNAPNEASKHASLIEPPRKIWDLNEYTSPRNKWPTLYMYSATARFAQFHFLDLAMRLVHNALERADGKRKRLFAQERRHVRAVYLKMYPSYGETHQSIKVSSDET